MTLPAPTLAPSGRVPRRLDSIVEAVGNTPLVRLRHVAAHVPSAEVWAKLEFANPGGSVKDRPALSMILDAKARGVFGAGKTLVDATSGNTGIAYSLFGAAMGFPVRLVMPENVSAPRKAIARAFGTEIVFSDPLEGSDGAIRVVRAMVAKNPDAYFYPDQYSNPANPRAHFDGTAPEILRALGDRITHFVAGVGTSGTMMGAGRRFRAHDRPVRNVAVEPDEPLHGLEGLKHMPSSLVPAIYDTSVPHETMRVGTEDGWDMADRLAREEGLHVGHSSGANVFAAVRVAEREHAAWVRAGASGPEPKTVAVAIVCDRGDRYFAPLAWDKRHVY